MPSPNSSQGISWVNPLNCDDDEDEEDSVIMASPDRTERSEGFAPVRLNNSLLIDAAGLSSDDMPQSEIKQKRTKSAKNEQLTPRAQAERDMARSRIAIFARTQEFGEVAVDELDMDPDLHEHMREWCGLKHPRTKVSITYDVVQFVLLLYIVIWVPWRIAFETETTPDEFVFWWDIFIDVALVFDMFLCMHRYYFDEIHHKLITDPKLIRRAYLKSWFIVDLASVIPFDIIIRYTMHHDGSQEAIVRSAKMIRLMRLARFAKIFRLTKVASLQRHTKSIKAKIRELGVGNQGAEFLARVAFLTAFIYLLLHVCACLWIFQARLQCTAGIFPTWYAIAYRDVLGIDFDNSSDIDDWELQQSPFLMMDPERLPTHPDDETVYIDALYLVLVTMGQVGYGDNLRPFNEGERFACATTIIFGAFVWAYIIGTFDTALAMMDWDKAAYDEWVRQIKAGLKYHDVPSSLVSKVDAFFDFKYEAKTLFRDEEIIHALPARLRRDLQLHRFREIIKRIPFFVDMHDEVVLQIVESMVSFALLPGDWVFHKGDPSSELVLLKKGRLAVVAEHAKASQPAWGTAEFDSQIYSADIMEAEYFPGAFFGEAQFLGFNFERDCSIRARTFCECYSLHPDDMEPMLRQHPALRRRLTHYANMKKNIEQRMAEDLWIEEMKARLHDAAESVGGWRALFETMDVDKSGELDSGEFRRAVRAAGVDAEDVDDTAVRRIFLYIDRDGSGTVELAEMLEVLTGPVLETDDPITRMILLHKEIEAQLASEKDELRKVFDEHAVQGHVVKDELLDMCAQLECPMKNWELEAAWRAMDPDERGWVEFEDFQSWYLATEGKVQAVRSKAELAQRTTEQFQEAARMEQKEMSRRIRVLERKLRAHVSAWAEIMALFRKKYGVPDKR